MCVNMTKMKYKVADCSVSINYTLQIELTLISIILGSLCGVLDPPSMAIPRIGFVFGILTRNRTAGLLDYDIEYRIQIIDIHCCQYDVNYIWVSPLLIIFDG